MNKDKCNYSWRQLIESWSGTTPKNNIKFYCIKCLKIKNNEEGYERNI